MAAGDLITITKNTMTAFDSMVSISAALTANAATAETDGLHQPWRYLPTKADAKCLLIVQGTGSAADGNLTMTLTAGVGGMAAAADATYTIVKNTTVVFVLDARYKQEDGYFEFSIDPAGSDKCKTDHALTVAVIELPA